MGRYKFLKLKSGEYLIYRENMIARESTKVKTKKEAIKIRLARYSNHLKSPAFENKPFLKRNIFMSYLEDCKSDVVKKDTGEVKT